MAQPKARILICDDHLLVREGLKLILERASDIIIVGYAENGQGALDFIEKNEIDVALMDISMPVMDGIEACKKISLRYPKVKVIFLSMIRELDMMGTLRESGSKGYLLKNSSTEELIEAISIVAGGDMYFDENVIEIAPQKSLRSLPKITKREKQILALILQEKSSIEIAEDLFISHGTVQTHRKNLIRKLDVKNTAGLVRKTFELNILGT